MTNTDTFTCEKYHCTLTRQACADRRAARSLYGKHNLPNYPGCQECEQGKAEAAGINTDHVVPTRRGNKIKSKEEGIMAFPSKIDNTKLKQMIAEGKFMDEIAKAFGVVETSVRMRIKQLGLTPNRRRQPKGAAADAALFAPIPGRHPVADSVRQTATGLTYKPEEMPAQIIPVILRLTVEVDLRVSAQGVA